MFDKVEILIPWGDIRVYSTAGSSTVEQADFTMQMEVDDEVMLVFYIEFT